MSLPSVIGYDRARKLSLWAIVAYVLTMAALLVAACSASGCGGAQQASAGATCGTMFGLIAARSDYSAERASADLDSQHSICDRLTTAPAEVTP